MGRRAVVTGAASGIGKAAAERLLREGVEVVAVDRDAAGLEPLAEAGATTLETAVYAASKTTVLSITRSFAYALAPRNIRVNAICPGIIDTPMQDKVLEGVAALRGMSARELSDRRTETVPLARGAAPSEAAAAIWFLLSDESSYMTGEAMNFSGGLAMW